MVANSNQKQIVDFSEMLIYLRKYLKLRLGKSIQCMSENKLVVSGGQVNSADPEELADLRKRSRNPELRRMDFDKSPRNKF